MPAYILYIIQALPMLCVLLNTEICETIVCQQALLRVGVGDGEREREGFLLEQCLGNLNSAH